MRCERVDTAAIAWARADLRSGRGIDDAFTGRPRSSLRDGQPRDRSRSGFTATTVEAARPVELSLNLTSTISQALRRATTFGDHRSANCPSLAAISTTLGVTLQDTRLGGFAGCHGEP